MRSYSTDAIGLLLLSFWTILFGFKVNLIDIGSSGLRLDDVILLCAIPLILFAVQELRVRKEFRWFLLFLLSSLISLVLGVKGGRIELAEGALYWLRNIQYTIFYFVGILLARHVNLDRVLRVYVWFLLTVITLQFADLLPIFSLYQGASRAVANTGGPYELAVMASLSALYFYFQQRRLLYVALSVLILILTQSRVTLIGLLAIFFLSSFKMRGRIVFAVVLAVVVVGFSAFDSGVLNRFALVLDAKTIDTFALITHDIPWFSETSSYRSWAFVDYTDLLNDIDGDRSTFIRFIRQFSLGSSLQHCGLECIFMGLGPSFASSAVDGNLLRLVVEYGFIGAFLFLLGIWRVAQNTGNRMIQLYFWLLVFTAIAIDILVSSKAMSLFWFLCGYYSMNNEISLSVNFVSPPVSTTETTTSHANLESLA